MSKIDYPFSTVIYSKDRYVKLHRRCFFHGKNVRATDNQVIDYVIWEHSGKGSGAFFTATHCDPWNGDRTKFCLQDIIDICNYNGAQFELSETSVILKEIHHELNMEVRATITERDNKMYITWAYRPYMHHNSITPILYMNEACTDEHLITVLDMAQLKQMFDFNKL
jgi:hypothetical protein